MERRPTSFQIPLRQAQLDHGISVQNIDCASSINEHSGELARELQACHQGIYHKWIIARIRQDAWVVLPAPGDVAIGPVHILRNCWHGRIDLLSSGTPTALVLSLTCEDHIRGIVLRWSSVLWWWW